MSILCGTDLSEQSTTAVEAAARLAARMKLPLHLVHALETGRSADEIELRGAALGWAERGLRKLAQRAAAQGANVEVHLEDGSADDVLLEVAERYAAKLIVIAALGRRRPASIQLGSHAERLAQRANVPLLVVRDPQPFVEWAHGARPLRIVFGVDATLASEHALQFINALHLLGPCEVTLLHVYWPPEQLRRFGLHGIRNYMEPDPDVTRALQRDFARRFGTVGLHPPKFRMEPHMGGIGARIADVALEEAADLIVVGSHTRSAIARLAEGSVSRDVLHRASVSVACIPSPPAATVSAATELTAVLVATDFSAAGNAAVPLAYAIAARGGTVHLIHVAPHRTMQHPTDPHDIFAEPSAHTASRERLAELAHVAAAGRSVSTQVHVLESDEPAEAICQAAARLGAQGICVGTRGRGLSAALLGSVAGAVVRGTRLPVLLAHEPLA